MSNDYFRFQRFMLRQDRCGMKVGTDGTLLGAWAHGGKHILDVGTGTGLIALMMAQRFPDAVVTGVDIDADACLQAQENVMASPFKVNVIHADVAEMEGSFDCIVSNPPYFNNSLKCPDEQRSKARHTSILGYSKLMQHAYRLLTDNGDLSLIIPSEGKSLMESEASLQGLFKVREYAVRTIPSKPPRRYLLAFRKHRVEIVEYAEVVLHDAPNVRSAWYHELTKDFYL